MYLFKTSVTCVILASLALCATAVKGNDIENPLSEPPADTVHTVERFYRTYEDGTVEFKLVLSNGLAQFQRITNKEYDGEIIRAYEGYYSTPMPDGTYSTTHYIADENGYRRIKQERDTKPPTLPLYVPYVPKV